MVQVRETNGELTVWWSDKDQPVATLSPLGAARSRHQRDQGDAELCSNENMVDVSRLSNVHGCVGLDKSFQS
jgi:hypothetical protein